MTDILPTDVSTTATRRRWLLPVIAVALLAAGLGVGLAIAAGRDDSSPAQASTAVQVSNVNQACTNWMMSVPATSAGTSDWCGDMTAWMNQQVTDGRMMGMMMWGDPDRMLASCQSWASSSQTGAPPLSWCDDMIAWMRQNMNGDWDGWMMNGSMMGR